MKVMFVHNKYAAVSGEERMIERIIDLLCEGGHEVSTFFKDSASIQSSADKVSAFGSGIWSRSAARDFSVSIEEFQPDIIQIQNLFPLISPSILQVARRRGVPVVMRLSNYRLFCPNGLLMTKGEICEKCMGGKEYWCILRNCERSIVKSAGYALRTAVARKLDLFKDGVTRYYAQTEFQRDLHVREGIPFGKIDVIPNFLNNLEMADSISRSTSGDYVGFSGRLSQEKGVDFLLDLAKRLPSIPFRLAGNPGQYADRKLPSNVLLCGHLDGVQLTEFYNNCRMLVLPSTWYEGFPGVALDAMRSGKPIVASRLGGIPEIVEDRTSGLLCSPANIGEFANAIEALWNDVALSQALGRAGRRKLECKYTRLNYYESLMSTYEKALSGARNIALD